MKDVPLVEISTNLSHICGRKGPETSQKAPFHECCAASPQKHLKIYNLANTNSTLMKLTMIMYLHKRFNMAEDWDVTHGA